MLRAATTGGFDYHGADPYDKTWRVRHTLAMREITRAANAQVMQIAHQHWLAYVSHSRLEAESWSNAKQQAHEVMQAIRETITPWQERAENISKKDTIEAKYGKLIKRYHDMVARKRAAREAAEKEQKANGENADVAQE